MSINLSNLTASKVSIGSSATTPSSTDPYWSSVTLLTETTSVNSGNNYSFKDSSPNNFSIITAGTSVTQGSFDPPVSGGHSGLFLNQGISLSNFAFSNYGACTFTIEAWVYPTVNNTSMSIFSQDNTGLNSVRNNFRIGGDNKLHYDYYDAGQGSISTTSTVPLNTWTHVAISRNGTSVKMFINGITEYAGTIATMWPSPGIDTYIGNTAVNSAPYTGYMSDVRVTTTAVYTSNFSVPTVPLTAITGTMLLLNFDNGNIYDATGKNNLFTLDNTQVSTAQKKFGTTSIKFDGTGDYLYIPANSNNFLFDSGEFTVEGWVYTSATTPVAGGIFQQSLSSFSASPINSVALGTVTAGQTWQIYAKNTNFNSTATWSTNVWYHFAVVRSSTTTKLYINGVSVISVADDTTRYTGTYMGLGAIYGATPYNLNGYMQDFRVTKGIARYTSDFTPPTAAFPTN